MRAGADTPQVARAKRGIARLEGLAPGDVRLDVHAWNGLVAHPNSTVTLSPGQVSDVHIALQEPAHLNGTLWTLDDQRVRAAEVHARALDGAGRLAGTVDSQGRFRFEDLQPGMWRLVAFGRGGAPVERDVLVEARTTTTVELRLRPAGRMHVLVLNAAGRPVPGALVAFRQGGRLVRSARPDRSDSAGRVERDGLPTGWVDVRAAHAEHGAAASQVEVKANATGTLRLTLLPE